MRILPLLAAGLMVAACRGPVRGPAEPTEAALTLRDRQLLEIIELEQAMDARAAEPDAEFAEIQRLFREVDQEYSSFLTRNRDDIEAYLLYGKMLLRYNDLEGARDRFLTAAALAERSGQQLAVVHQQLSTICAEEGDYSRAVVFADNAIKIEPETAAYHYGLGQILAAYRQPLVNEGFFTQEEIDQRILQSFDTARLLEPGALPLQFRYGEAFYDVANPDWQTALQFWQSLAANPDLSPLQRDATLLHQARCLIELGQPKAARDLTRAIESPQLQPSAKALFGDQEPE